MLPPLMRASSTTAAAAAAIALTFAAGCLSDTPLGDTQSDALDAVSEAWSVKFEGTCWEAGFVAPSAMEKGDWLTEPFVRADVYEEIGKPMINQAGKPQGPISGNWHQGFQCPAAVRNGEVVEDFIWGWVGDAVEPPPFDHGGADWHVYTTGFGLENGTYRDALLDDTQLDLTHTTSARIDFLAGDLESGAVIYEEMVDLPKGIYESQGFVTKYRDLEPRTIRMWWLVPADGSESPLGRFHEEDLGAATVTGGGDDHMAEVAAMKWNPVYLDLKTGGGAQYTSIGGTNYACHGGIAQHGPQGELCLPEVTVVYEHTSLELTFGRVLTDVTVDDFFWH